MNIKKFAKKILYKSEKIYSLIKHNGCKYHIDLFKKKNYKYLLKTENFNYEGSMFYYYINEKIRCINSCKIIDNISISYEDVLIYGLDELLKKTDDECFKEFIKEYIVKIIDEVSRAENNYSKDIIEFFRKIRTSGCSSFKEAIQRILFYNQLMWQTGHKLNVLGRLDYVLGKYYKNEDSEINKAIVLEFLTLLHKNYYYKSSALKGDTGQVIILGGLNKDNVYFCNELTYLFIECIREFNKPDPKILLRVSKQMPDNLLSAALNCISAGNGSPLLSNDDIVIKSLINIGYSAEDASNYATSACWEPLCDGASLEQNNICDLNFIEVFNQSLANADKINSFDSLVTAYKNTIKDKIYSIVNYLNKASFSYDPLLTCLLRTNKDGDISLGTAKYNNFGIITTGFGNVVNAILNIDRLVFKEKKYSLNYLISEMKKNFPDEDLRLKLKNNDLKYAIDDENVINLVNDLIDYVSCEFSKYKNQFGGIYRFGLSSPNYITSSKKTLASLDGRKNFDPFIVHISCESGAAYTSILNFASNLHYDGMNVNGNVIDLMISKKFMDNNFEKIFILIKTAICNGFFQMQFNVINSSTMIDAQKNPEKYQNLIVRVWGFSAYFVELPIEYQNLLIERAKKNESINF